MPLAIAYWLQMDHRVEGVWNRLQQISTSYQTLQAENEEQDLLTLVVLTVHELVAEGSGDITVPTRAIAERVNQMANGQGDAWDMVSSYQVQRVGNMMRRLGFEKAASHGSNRSWRLSCRKLEQIAKARGIPLGLQFNRAEVA